MLDQMYIVPAVAERLLNFLSDKDNRHALVLGEAGSGKTSLLFYIADQLKKNGAVVAHVNAAANPSVDGLIASIAKAFYVEIPSASSSVRASQGTLDFRPILHEIRTLEGSVYLFLDDIDAVLERRSLTRLLENLLSEGRGKLRVVLCSRSSNIVSRFQRSRLVDSFEVGGLTLAESAAFIKRAAGESISSEALHGILSIANGNPLFLRLASEAIKKFGAEDVVNQIAQDGSAIQVALVERIFDIENKTYVEQSLLRCLVIFECATEKQLESVTGMSETEVGQALESLRRVGLIVKDSSDWRYSHVTLFEIASTLLFPNSKLNPGSLSFGAEAAEQDTLLESQFVAPPDLSQVMSGDKTVILGDRGAGKSAVFRSLGGFQSECPNQAMRAEGVIVSLSKDPATFLQKYSARDTATSSADRFKALWLLFCASLAARDIHPHLLDSASASEYVQASWKLLRQVGWNRNVQGEGRIRKSWERVKGILPNKVSFSAGPVTIEPEWARSGQVASRSGLEIDEFIDKTDKTLEEHEMRLLIVVDQIDDFHKYAREQQEAMIQGLFLAETYLSQKQAIRLVILLRTDLYEVYDIQEKNKFVSRTVVLNWSWPQIVLLLLGRVFANIEFKELSSTVTSLGITSETTDIFLRLLFPSVLEGKSTQNWLYDSLKNCRGDVAPRQIVLFLNYLKKHAHVERSHIPIFTESEIIAAMHDVSQAAYEEVVNDFRVAVAFVRNCRSGKISEFRLEEVTGLFDATDGSINNQVDLLERLGFLERQVVTEDGEALPQFSIPLLYSRCWNTG